MPTNKQKIVAKDLMENHGKPISQAMLDAGYDATTAKNPSNLTNSIGWQELMDKYLPDDLVLDTHKAGLEATKQLSVRGGRDANAESDDFIEVPDHPTRLKAVELAYKVKRKTEGNVAIQVNNFIPILGGESHVSENASNQ